MWRSLRALFVAILVGYFVVSQCATAYGWFLILGNFSIDYSGGRDAKLGGQLIEVPERMTYPVSTIHGVDDVLRLRYRLALAAVFWAGLVTSALWVVRATYRRLFCP